MKRLPCCRAFWMMQTYGRMNWRQRTGKKSCLSSPLSSASLTFLTMPYTFDSTVPISGSLAQNMHRLNYSELSEGCDYRTRMWLQNNSIFQRFYVGRKRGDLGGMLLMFVNIWWEYLREWWQAKRQQAQSEVREIPSKCTRKYCWGF